MNTYQSRIKAKIEEINTLKHVKLHYEESMKQLEQEKTVLNNLRNTIDSKFKDWESTEKVNIRSVFHKILGNQEQQIEKGRQEYLKTSLEYSEALKSVDLLEFEVKILHGKLGDDAKLSAELEELKQHREREIMSSNFPEKQKLIALNTEIEQHLVWFKDAREAHVAGAAATETLAQMSHLLKTAKNWGKWDMASKNVRQPKNMKYNHVDQAIRLSPRAKQRLQVFATELEDIGKNGIKLDFRLEQFSRFGNVFFDNLISDWVVQQKIQNSLLSVQEVLNTVNLVANTVVKEMGEQELKMKAAEGAKDILLQS